MSKILIISHEYFPDQTTGIGKFAETVATCVSEVTAASLSLKSFRGYKGGGLALRPEPYVGEISLLDDLIEQNARLFDLLARGAKETRLIQLVHCCDWLVWESANAIAEKLGVPIAISLHSNIEFRVEHGFTDMPSAMADYAIATQRKALGKSDISIFRSVEEKIALERYVGAKSAIIPVARSLQPRNSIPKSGIQNTIDSEKLRLLFFGRIDYEKGIDRVLAMIPHIDFPCEITFAGSGALESMLDSPDLPAHITVHYIGWVDGVDELIRQTHIVLVPSRYDPGPNVVLEAIAERVPFIVSPECDIAKEKNISCSSFVTDCSEGRAIFERIQYIKETYASRLLEVARMGYALSNTLRNVDLCMERLRNLYDSSCSV